MYYYVISFALSTPMAIGLIVSLIFRAYILLYLSFIMSVSLHLHSSLIHSLICTKNDSKNNLFSEYVVT